MLPLVCTNSCLHFKTYCTIWYLKLNTTYETLLSQSLLSLYFFHTTERLKIIKQPKSIAAKAGAETAILACEARGFPYPKYQWYKAFATDDRDRQQVSYEEVENENDKVFRISPVTVETAGAYCCQVYHSYNSTPQQVFSEWAYLQVLSAPEGEFTVLFPFLGGGGV